MNVEIANRLVQLRKQSNLSQEELAMRLGISRQAVSKWERAESSPDTDNLIALAALYKLSLDDLLHSDLPPEPTAYTPPYRPETIFSAEVPTLDGSYYEVKGEEEEETVKEPVKQEVSDPLPEGSFYDTKEGHLHKNDWLHQVPYPLYIVALYLVLGFILNQWHPGWLIFMTIPLHYMPEKDKRMPLVLGNPILIPLVYLVIGFYFHIWHPTWLIFLLIPIIQSTRGGKKIKNAEENSSTENS